MKSQVIYRDDNLTISVLPDPTGSNAHKRIYSTCPECGGNMGRLAKNRCHKCQASRNAKEYWRKRRRRGNESRRIRRDQVS